MERNPAQEDDLGFVPLKKKKASSKGADDLGFVPLRPIDEEPKSFLDESLETLGDVATTAPQGLTSWADEIQAAAQAGGKKAFGAEEPFEDIYEEDVAKIRQNVSKARARSPYATAATELGVGIGSAFIPGAGAVLGAGKFASAPAMIARGAFEGLGTAEDKASISGVTQTGIGAGLGAAGSLVSGALKKVSTANPAEIRANVLGARTSEFKEVGSRDRTQIAEFLNDLGLFKNDKMDFDVTKMKFVSKGKSLENLEKPTKKVLLDRLDDASNKIKSQKEAILGNRLETPINYDKLQENLLDSIDDFSGKGSGGPKRFSNAEAIKNEILTDIENEMDRLGIDYPTVGILEEAKNRISNELTAIGKDPLLARVPESADIYKRMYGTINDYLKAALKDTKYSDLNSAQSKMLVAKTDLLSSIASEEARTAQAGWGGWGNKLLNETLGTPESGLGMAKVADFMNLPGLKQMKTPARLITEEAPFSAIRYSDPSARGGSYQSRSPQSIGFSQKDIINFKIPRNTQAVMENKDMVLAKLVQKGADPMVIDAVAEGLNGSGDDIANVMPLLVTQMPTLFEKAKYSTFDGKFLDPNDRAKAADDISKRDDMNSIQRAKMINKINKSGEVPEGL
jgi:hypothetical protein